MILDKNNTLFERNEKEEFIPQKVILELLEDKPEVMVTPMPRGKTKEILAKVQNETSFDEDIEVIKDHLIEPKYTEDELKAIKPTIATAIATAIWAISLDVTQPVLKETDKKEAAKDSDFLSK